MARKNWKHPHELAERNREIYRQHLKGKSYTDLGHKFYLTNSRIGAIVTRARKAIEREVTTENV